MSDSYIVGERIRYIGPQKRSRSFKIGRIYRVLRIAGPEHYPEADPPQIMVVDSEGYLCWTYQDHFEKVED